MPFDPAKLATVRQGKAGTATSGFNPDKLAAVRSGIKFEPEEQRALFDFGAEDNLPIKVGRKVAGFMTNIFAPETGPLTTNPVATAGEILLKTEREQAKEATALANPIFAIAKIIESGLSPTLGKFATGQPFKAQNIPADIKKGIVENISRIFGVRRDAPSLYDVTLKSVQNLDKVNILGWKPDVDTQEKKQMYSQLITAGYYLAFSPTAVRRALNRAAKVAGAGAQYTAEFAKEATVFTANKIAEGVEAQKMKADFVQKFTPRLGREKAVRVANELDKAIKEMAPSQSIKPDYLAKHLFGIERPAGIVSEAEVKTPEAVKKPQAIKPTKPAKVEATKAEEIFTAKEAPNKTIADIDRRWDVQNDIFEATIKIPNEQKIDALKKQLEGLKGQRGPEITAAKKDIQEKIKSLQGKIDKAEEDVRDEMSNFQEELTDDVIEEAKKQGLNLEEEEWTNFIDDLSTKILETRGYREGYDEKGISNYNRPIKDIIQETIDEWKATYPLKNITTKEKAIEIARPAKADEFKVGDILDPQGKTNMVGNVTIREISGNTLKFIDSEGTEFSGMQRSTVRTLVKEGSWKKVESPTEGEKEQAPTPTVETITSTAELEGIIGGSEYTKEYKQAARERLTVIRKEEATREEKLKAPAGSEYKLVGYYDTTGETEKEITEYGSKAPERKFKADLTKYSKALAAELGYEHDADKKGKKLHAETNVAPAGGDGHIVLWKPNSNYGIYISVSVNRANGDDLDIGGTVGDIMYRATTKGDKWTGSKSNNFIDADITVKKFADIIKREVDFYDEEIKETETLKKPKTSGILIEGEGETHEIREGRERSGSLEEGSADRAIESERPDSESTPQEVGVRRREPVQSAVNRQRSKPSYKPGTEQERDTQEGNYLITDADQVGIGTPKVKYKDNIVAIKLLKTLESENRKATKEEQAILVKYVGWGGLSKVFNRWNNEGWIKEYEELKSLLTDEEYEAARESTINAHYTSPQIIKFMWNAVQRLGFKGGKVLEPGMGVGHFLGLRPNIDVSFTGVELDSLTGRIAKQLYQHSDIYVKGFQDTLLSKNFYDLSISNVPFADVTIYDPKFKNLGIPRGLFLHDYFFAKSIALTKPGGLIAFITSKGTMDKQNPKVREWINGQADLIGAVRLPRTAFKATAGTEVVTDIILLRKRLTGEQPSGKDWVNSKETKISNRNVYVNEYFTAYPETVLGTMKVGKGLYGDQELTVEPFDTDLQDGLNTVLQALPEGIIADPVDIVEEEKKTEKIAANAGTKQDSFVLQEGKIYQKAGEQLEERNLGVNKDRMTQMIRIRDATKHVIDTQLSGATDAELKEAQSSLNTLYDKFVKKYGYLNNKINEDLIWDDPESALLLSLEIENKKTKTFSKARIFSGRTISQQTKPTKADTSKDALLNSLAWYGKINWEYIDEIYSEGSGNAQQELLASGVIFKNPEGEQYELRDEYLSGNVKSKLKLAEAAIRLDKQYQQNINELQKAIPADLTFDQIGVKIGTPWIDPTDYKQFLAETLQSSPCDITVEHNIVDGKWNIELNKWSRKSTGNLDVYGTERYPADKLFKDIANHRSIVVKDKVKNEEGGDTYVINEQQTAIAQDKAEILKQKFKDWFWIDDARRDKYTKHYNENFNNTVNRRHDGSHLVFPGLNPEIKLRKSQVDAIWRLITSNRLMLAHEVGAGKTFIGITGLMESKRLGLVKKPLIVVPKNTLSQWKREWLRLYPNARILVADERNFITHRRERFLGKVATGDWDAVILGESSNELISVSEKLYEEYIAEKVADLREQKNKLKVEGSRITVKQIEKAIERLENKLKEKLSQDKKGKTVDFEELGIDSVFVDEADKFKNLAYETKMENVRGLGSVQGNNKTEDLMMKIKYMQKNGGKIIFATGTPISNTMAEVYSMMKYLQPELLQERGIEHFDDWANNFGETLLELEIDVTGGRYKPVNRFRKFMNLPELMQMIREVWDIQTAEMLEEQGILVKGVHLPNIKGGKPSIIILPPSENFIAYKQVLIERAEKIKGKRVKKGGDNMLVILNDGVKASTDMRIIDPNLPAETNSKIEYAIPGIYERWKEGKADKSTQIIFLDKPSPVQVKDKFNPYKHIKQQLIKKGIPSNEIAFIHDYGTAAQKEALYEKVNAGDIRVLFGSTEKLGAGTNVQERLKTEWQIDVPFRPRDIWQREGRIVRQGNTNTEVEIIRLVTKGSLDTFMYQLLESKARAIAQVMSGKSDARSIEEEISEYAITKALSSDNPLVKEKAKIDKDVRRLEAMKQAYIKQGIDAKKKIKDLPQQLDRYYKTIAEIKEDIKARPEKPTKENFKVTVDGKDYTEKESAWKALKDRTDKINVKDWLKDIEVGKYLGFNIVATVKPAVGTYPKVTELNLKGKSYYTAILSESAVGTFASIDNAIFSQPERDIERITTAAGEEEKNLTTLKGMADLPFQHQKELEEKQKRQIEVNRLLKEEVSKQPVEEEKPAIEQEIGENTDKVIEEIKKSQETGAVSVGGVIPKCRRVDDKIHTELKSTDPEVEARWQESKGIKTEKLFFSIWNSVVNIFKQFKEFPELGKDPKYAFIKNDLRRLQELKGIAQDRVLRLLNQLIYRFGPNKLELFTRKIVLDDLMYEMGRGHELPFGYKQETLETDQKNITEIVDKNPDIREALEQRKALLEAVKKDLVNAGIMDEEAFKNPSYFRHQVIEYAQAARLLKGSRLRAPSPGYAKRRYGSALDINTDYLQAEFEWLSQAFKDIEVAKVINKLDNSPLNIKARLKVESAQHNKKLMDSIEVPDLVVDGRQGTLTDLIRRTFNTKIAMSFANLEQLGYVFNEHDAPETFAELSRIAQDVEGDDDTSVIAARTILKNISERKKAIKKYLGNSYKEWRDIIPEGYGLWQPKQGNLFFTTKTLPQRIIDNLLREVGSEVGITVDDLRSVVVLGGKLKELVLPEDLIKTIEDSYSVFPNTELDKLWRVIVRTPLALWKRWILFSPMRAFSYNYQNMLGDLSAAFAGNPHALAKTAQAAQELWSYYYGEGSVPQTLSDFIARRGVSAALTIQELPDIQSLDVFKRFNDKPLRDKLNVVKLWFTESIKFSKWREGVLRYAAYLDYLEKLETGDFGRGPLKAFKYGASNPDEIEGLTDNKDKAAKLATDLLGDYGALSPMGKNLRQYIIPFWSWHEINLKRYARLFANAAGEGPAGGSRTGAAFAVLSTGYAALWAVRFAMLWLMMQLWNNLIHPDLEDQMSEYDKRRGHIILGKDEKTGEVLFRRGQDSFGDYMEWFGLNKAMLLWRQLSSHQITVAQAAVEMAKSPVNKFLNGISPFIMGPIAMLTGKRFYEDFTKPITVKDRGAVIADSLAVRDIYNAATGRPMKPGGLARAAGAAFVQRKDPQESSYKYIRERKSAFLEKLGKGGSGDYYTPRSRFYADYKKALAYGDQKAAQRALDELKKLGASRKDMERSIKTAHPLSGLSKAEQSQFVYKFLSNEDRTKLQQAFKYYDTVFKKKQKINVLGAMKTSSPKERKTMTRILIKGGQW